MPIRPAAKTPSVPATMGPRTSRAFFIRPASRCCRPPRRRPARGPEAAGWPRRRPPGSAGRRARPGPLAGSCPLPRPAAGWPGPTGDPGWSTVDARPWSVRDGGADTPPPNSAGAARRLPTATQQSGWDRSADHPMASRLSYLLCRPVPGVVTFTRFKERRKTLQRGGKHPRDVPLMRDHVPPDLLMVHEIAHGMDAGLVVRAENLEDAGFGEVHPLGDFRERRRPAEALPQPGDRLRHFAVELPHPPGRPHLVDGVTPLVPELL